MEAAVHLGNYHIPPGMMGSERRDPEAQRLLPDENDAQLHERVYRAGVYISGIFYLGLVLLLSFMCYLFYPTLGQVCDRPLKLWCLVFVPMRIMQNIVADRARIAHYQHRLPSHLVGFFIRLLDAMSLAWFCVGYYLIFYVKPCNAATHILASWLWWIQAMIYLLPCCLLGTICCCLPLLVLLFVRFGITGDQSIPAASEAELERVKVKKFSEAVNALAEQYGEDKVVLVKGRRQMLMSRVNALGGMAGFMGLGESFMRGGQEAVPPTAAPTDAIQIKTECPICMGDLELDDEVAVLPCDSRHIFHKACAFQWLKMRAQCPICVANLRNLWSDGEVPLSTSGSRTRGSPRASPEL